MLKDFSIEQFDVIIQAGQSNAEGCGLGDAQRPWEPNDRVWYLNNDFTISRAAETISGNQPRSDFSLSFAREYLENGCLDEGRKLLIIRSAVGGTGFLDKHWGPDDDHNSRMLKMIETALSLNPANRLVALLWHQGETDAVLNASYETHYANLLRFVRDTRAAFGVPELPFIAGDFVQHWEDDNSSVCAPVVDAIRAVCRDCGFGAFVETDGLLSNRQFAESRGSSSDDTIHFCRESLYELGKRYFREYAVLSKA